MRTASTWGTWTARSKESGDRFQERQGRPRTATGASAETTPVAADPATPGVDVVDLRGPRVDRIDLSEPGIERLDRDLAVLTAPEAVDLDEVVTRPPLELHEIHPYVQRELAGLEIMVQGSQSVLYRMCKRMIDLVVAVPLLVLAAPIIGLMSLAIRLESKGPAVFRQQRVGADGQVFTFYKFRTMYVDAKERFPDLYDYDFETSELSSRYYKHANDPRNTRLGALIRQTTLDELPNLFNVVKGDTSLVGPRPELPEMIRHYQPSQLVKFTVKPGLTGLAACTGRNTLTIDEQIRADVEYVAGQSMKMDLWIMAETAKMIVKSVGAE